MHSLRAATRARDGLRPRTDARSPRARSRQPARAQDPGFLLAAALLVLAIVLGGGTRPGLTSDLIVQLASLPVLGWGLLRLRERPPARLALLGLGWFALVALVFAFQCLPLPHELWTQLGGRAEIAGEMQRAGVAVGAHPITFSPYATERMLWTLLPPLALFTCAISLDERDRLRLVVVLFVMAAISIVLGLAQVAGGPHSPLRFYEITNPTEAVGFFANRNHYAALLYMVLPLAIAWLGARVLERSAGKDVPILQIIALALLVMLLILGLVLSRSRAGIALGMVGLVGGVLAALPAARRASGTAARAGRVLVVTCAIGLLLAVQYGLYGVLERLTKDPMEDARWVLVSTTLEASRHFGAFGTGFGTFLNAYGGFETVSVQFSSFINHAHNDWLECWLEGKALIVLPLVAFAILLHRYIASEYAAWGEFNARKLKIGIAIAAVTGGSAVATHEIIDYPLRAIASSATFALLVAILAARETCQSSVSDVS